MDLLYSIDALLEQSKKPVYYFILIAHALYFITFLGIAIVNTTYLQTLDMLTQTFICIFLLFRFNPFRKDNSVLEKYDKKIIFGSGLLLFSNLVAVKLAKYLPQQPISILVQRYGVN